MGEVPGYIRKRIERPVPPDCGISLGSVPVLSDGDPSKAKVATIGLNPRKSAHLPQASDPENVWQTCNNYFNPEWPFRNPPNRDWVDNWLPILDQCQVSYTGESACNLDLVKWPLQKPWSKNNPDLLKYLLEKDVPFLEKQLQESDTLKLVLGNGSTVKGQFQQRLGAEIREDGRLAGYSTKLFCGKIPQKTSNGEYAYKMFIGWNHFLSYPPKGVDSDKWRLALAKRVGELYRNGC